MHYLKFMFLLLVSGILLITIIDRSEAVAACTVLTEINTGFSSVASFRVAADGVNVVWSRSDGSDQEIYLYNTDTHITTQVTNNTAYDDYPVVDGDYIVWQGNNAQFYADIWAYYIPTGQISNLSNTATSNESEQALDGRYVVWTIAGDLRIYDLQTAQIIRSITLTDFDRSSRLSGNYLLWENYNTGTGFSRIKLHNIVANTTVELFNSGSPIRSLYGFMIDGDYVIWNASDGTDAEVFLYRISTGVTTNLSNNSVYDGNALLAGNVVLWSNQINSNPARWDAYRYQIDTATTTKLTDDPLYEYYLQASGSNLAWSVKSSSPDDYDVVIYDQTDNSTTPVTNNTFADVDLQFTGDTLLWKRLENGVVWLVISVCRQDQPTPTPTSTLTSTATSTPTSTLTETPTDMPTNTPTVVPSDTATSIPTLTATLTATNTPTVTSTATDTPTDLPSATPSDIPSPTASSTGPAPSASPTQTPTVTDPPLATSTEPASATASPTATASPSPTATAAASSELLLNGGFEPDASFWTVTMATGDKVKCNKADKIVAHSGNCAFQFKGGAGEHSALGQTIAAPGLQINDTLELKLYYSGKGSQISGKVKLRVKYTDDTTAGKINADLTSTEGYVELVKTVQIMSPAINKIKLQILHTSRAGKLYLDDVSFRKTGQGAPLILLP